jgi:hypothetical protein
LYQKIETSIEKQKIENQVEENEESLKRRFTSKGYLRDKNEEDEYEPPGGMPN